MLLPLWILRRLPAPQNDISERHREEGLKARLGDLRTWICYDR